jgi:hypothetical protein
VVAVAARWGQDPGQAVQELEGGEADRRAAGGIGVGEEVVDLVSAATEKVEAVEREGLRGSRVTILPESEECGRLKNLGKVVGWFFESPMHWPHGFSQREVLVDFEPPVEPVSPSFRYSRPVAVLLDSASRSAADLPAELMRHLPQVTTVGDPATGMAYQDHEDMRQGRDKSEGFARSVDPFTCPGGRG